MKNETKQTTQMKIDYDSIIDNSVLSPPKGHPHRGAIKIMLKTACEQVLDEAAERLSAVDDSRDDFEEGYFEGLRVSKRAILALKKEL